MPTSQMLSRTYGRSAVDRRVDAREPSLEGARAALECFYFAFNQRSLDALEAVWAPGTLISLDNPLGGIMRGLDDIRALYQRIFSGPAQVWVEFHDVVEYVGQDTVVFAGRERGEFARDSHTVPLAIRTSRVFQYFGGQLGWRQVHHHGSIDDPEALVRYQQAVRGGHERRPCTVTPPWQ
ncbi:MAG: nuclear transport factor 2 family protein [Thiomonas sp.]|uniref:YybH family protein n=1 Tax=Thiomonas sp. TaxID=2047785 RepID=UPI002A35D893|nr:nuclear transport factor 2 family protein [Thiomonas sp.]MDY0329202.1 nuclear transport factor 2 family protein [Thiomonas sp.]